MKRVAQVSAFVIAMMAGWSSASAQDSMVFMSEIGTPIAEAQTIRDIFAAGFPKKVEFVTEQLGGPFVTKVTAEYNSGKPVASLLGGSHSEFAVIKPMLLPLDKIGAELPLDKMQSEFVEMGKLGTDSQYYVPWHTAVFMGAANKEALQYLPEGTDVQKLTYDQLIEWGRNIEKATGQKKIGLPIGPKGLLHRLLTNSFVPAYAGGAVTNFRTEKGAGAWKMLKDMWTVTNPNSTTYAFMQDQLLSGDVWIAFDHNVRLKGAFEARPDDFVAFPVPAGPEGRAYAAAVSGIAILANGPDQEGAAEAMKFLTSDATHQEFIKRLGFFPPAVTKATLDGLDGGLRKLAEGVNAQLTAPDALVGYQPVGLGERSGEYQKVYLDTFQRIVLRNEPIQEVLDDQAKVLNEILTDTGARCWPSDKASENPCQAQ